MAGTSIPYPMVTDVNGSIGRLYDVYDMQNGVTLRGTFIIDPEGYIHGAEVLTSPIGRSSGEILRQLKAFQNYVSTGQLMPCDWQPGDKTLTQSLDSAGQIWKEWRPKEYQ